MKELAEYYLALSALSAVCAGEIVALPHMVSAPALGRSTAGRTFAARDQSALENRSAASLGSRRGCGGRAGRLAVALARCSGQAHATTLLPVSCRPPSGSCIA